MTKSKSSIKNSRNAPTTIESRSAKMSIAYSQKQKKETSRSKKRSIEMSNRVSSNSQNLRSTKYDKKKLSKVEALFNKTSFDKIDIKNILNNWRILQYVYLSLGTAKPINDAVNSFFLNVYKKQYNLFLNGFTKYNKIRKKIFTFMELEFWAFYLLFYFHYEAPKMDDNLKRHFESILTHLTKNTFYVGLILLKAANNKVLDVKIGYLQDFVNRSQTFNFKTGVPLIKTLRSNNEAAYKGIKAVLQFAGRAVNKFFSQSYSQDFADYTGFLDITKKVFVSHIRATKKFLFRKMDDNHFYGKDGVVGPKGRFYDHCRNPIGAGEFLSGTLDSNKNGVIMPGKQVFILDYFFLNYKLIIIFFYIHKNDL